jgi:hypothetical protein
VIYKTKLETNPEFLPESKHRNDVKIASVSKKGDILSF